MKKLIKKPKVKRKVAANAKGGRPRGGNPVIKFDIKKGIKIPSHKRGSLRNQLPFADMEVGDCFDVPHDKERWKTVQSGLASIRNYINAEELNYVARVDTNDDGQEVIRVWRTLT